MPSDTKIRKRYEDHGFGFKVVLRNVPMRKRMGEWCPEINWQALADELFAAMAVKPSRLTGQEVRFIRKKRGMTLTEFAERFGVTHPAVMKWERAEDGPTGMNWAMEKDIRLAILAWTQCKPEAFFEAYAALEKIPAGKTRHFTFDAQSYRFAA